MPFFVPSYFYLLRVTVHVINTVVLTFSLLSPTGEGIHTAMVAGKIAAHSVSDMFKCHNFTLHAMKAYGETGCCVSLSGDCYECVYVMYVLMCFAEQHKWCDIAALTEIFLSTKL